MSFLDSLFGRRKEQEPFDPNPGETHVMPARPYRVVQANLPFYSDADCRTRVEGARLLILQCEDPNQKQRVLECMPALKEYSPGQIVQWELNNKNVWETAWYVNPDTGKKEQAWSQAVEFQGRVVKV